MKKIRFTIKKLSAWMVAAAMLLAVSCDKNESSGGFDNTTLEAAITEATTLLNQSTEGTVPGNFKPGSKKELEGVLEWAVWMKTNSTSLDKTKDAANKVKIYIDRFKSNVVKLAVPLISQDNKTYIEITDNPIAGVTGKVKELTSKSYTLEAKFYILDLQQKGYANEFFANAMGGGGANDRGFELRYFGDGHVDINVGGGSGWKSKSTATGVVKAGQWMHITFVNDITSQKLYVDGVEVAAQTELYQNSDADYPLTIGNIKQWDDRVINGMVKDFRLWSAALTATQINENKSKTLTGTEANLAVYFPFNADLGNTVSDAGNKFLAKFVGSVSWVEGGIPPVIELKKEALQAAKAKVEALISTIAEGTNTGDYPVGTKDYLQILVTEATAVLNTAKRQDELDGKATSITEKLALVNEFRVALADGIYVDREDPKSVGFRITPNYTPQGDYTVEFDVKVKTFNFDGTGEFFNNGEFGCWIYGYKEITEEAIRKAGGLWNFTSTPSDGWKGPKTDPLVMKTGVWQHVAIVHDNTARTTAIYVDGVEKAKSTNIGAPNVSGWGEIWLGNGWGKMNGSIKDFRLWNSVRTANQLNTEITGTESDLELYFPLDKVGGVKFKDTKGKYYGEVRGAKWNLK